MKNEKLTMLLKDAYAKNLIVRNTFGQPVSRVLVTTVDRGRLKRGIYLKSDGTAELTVEQVAEKLSHEDKDMQVMDFTGNRIYYTAYKSKNSVPNGEGVYLETVADMDVETELEAVFKHAEENNKSEYDVFLTLGENGMTLKDFEGTRFYNYAKQFTETHSWEQ